MECATADEMVLKLSKCEEAQPSMFSVLQIAEDPHQIWKRDLAVTAPVNKFGGVHFPNEEKSGSQESPSSSVLPMQLQVFPFHAHWGPGGVLRLFFIDGELLAVSHSSHCTYYAEVVN
jgi:hypothetical protein